VEKATYIHHRSHQPALRSPSLPLSLPPSSAMEAATPPPIPKPSSLQLPTSINGYWIPYRMEPPVSSTTGAISCIEGHNRCFFN
jgi:hypothetical protein